LLLLFVFFLVVYTGFLYLFLELVVGFLGVGVVLVIQELARAVAEVRL
jgi:hypothetical protein